MRTVAGATIAGLLCICSILYVDPSIKAVGQETTISSTPSQTIQGWGIFPFPRHKSLLGRPQIADAIFALQPDFIRLAVNEAFNSDGSINSAEVDKIANHIKLAQGYDIDRYILTTFTPPRNMKSTRTDSGIIDKNDNRRHDFGETRSTLLPQYEEAFVAAYVNALHALQARGVGLPVAISIQNEPDWSPPWAGNKYSGKQWRRVVKKMRAGLDQAGLSEVAIHGPEAGGYLSSVAKASYLGGNGYSELAADPELDRALGAYAFHSYNRCKIRDNVRGMQRFPKDVWQTEWSIPGGNTELDWSIRGMQHLMSDLVALKFNYWSWWWAWNPSPSGSESLITGSKTPSYTKPYYVYKKLWDVVNPGWRVHHMSTNDSRLKDTISGDCASGVDMLAFENPNGTATVVLLTNPTASNIALRVKGLKGRTIEVFRTTGMEDMKRQGIGSIQGGAYTVNLPAKSVVLIDLLGNRGE